MCICNHNKIHVQFMHLTPSLSEDKYYHYKEYVTESLLKRVFKTNADGALPTKGHTSWAGTVGIYLLRRLLPFPLNYQGSNQ